MNVLPGSTVDLYGNITGGKLNAGTWTVEDATGGKTSSGTSFTRTDSANSALRTSIVVGFDGKIDPCPYSGSSTFDPNWMKAASYLTVKLASTETPSALDKKRILVCDDPSKHKMHIVPNYKTLYASQPWDTKAVLWGMVEQGIAWKVASQPPGGDGRLISASTADTVFSATVAGRYVLQACSTSTHAPSVCETVTYFVSGNPQPRHVQPDGTVPVDSAVDPALIGHTYEIGPTQKGKYAFSSLNAALTASLARSSDICSTPPGTTFRVHNEDTTGKSPTRYFEYVQTCHSGKRDQPIRWVGVPDAAGQLPIIDGDHATTRASIPKPSFYNSAANGYNAGGAFEIYFHQASSYPNYYAPSYNAIEGFAIQHFDAAHRLCPAGSASGVQTCKQPESYWTFTASGIRIQNGFGNVIAGNHINGVPFEIFSEFNSLQDGWSGMSADNGYFGNNLENCGNPSNDGQHCMYLQDLFKVVSGNKLSAVLSDMKKGAGGNLIKTRFGNAHIDSNDFVSVYDRNIDLVNNQDSFYVNPGDYHYNTNAPDAKTDGQWRGSEFAAMREWNGQNFIKGNTIEGEGESQGLIHDCCDSEPYSLDIQSRSLYLYNNTASLDSRFYKGGNFAVVDTRTQYKTNRMDMAKLYIVNNVFKLTDPERHLTWTVTSAPLLFFGKNIVSSRFGPNTLAADDSSSFTSVGDPDSYNNASAKNNVSGANRIVYAKGTAPFHPMTYAVTGDVAGDPLTGEMANRPVFFQFSPADGYQRLRIHPVTGSSGGIIGSVDISNGAVVSAPAH